MAKLEIKPPGKKQKTETLADMEPELKRALSLAMAARDANAAGNHAKAAALMAEHDSIFDQLEKLLPRI